MRPIEKPHRLSPERYRGRVKTVFTAAEMERRPVLARAQIFDLIEQVLAAACDRMDCFVPGFTVMPDHVHVLVAGHSDTSDTYEAMRYFKWKSAVEFRRLELGVSWQKDFHDHVIRTSDDWLNHARYIALNPVRKRLVEFPADWSHTGRGQVFVRGSL
jgi:REP element-mobilizing transposase RayT